MAPRLKTGDGDRANDPEAIFDKHLKIVVPLRTAMQKAKDAFASVQGEYRAAIKAADSDGLPKKAFLQFLKIREEDPEQVTLDMQALNRMLVWGKLPVGAQLGLFPDGETAATKAENAAAKAAKKNGADEGDEVDLSGTNDPDELATVEANGYVAGRAGKEGDGGGFAQHSRPYRSWMKGFNRAVAERAKDLKGGKRQNGRQAAPAEATTSPAADPPEAPVEEAGASA
jgi:hypothetical protein